MAEQHGDGDLRICMSRLDDHCAFCCTNVHLHYLLTSWNAS